MIARIGSGAFRSNFCTISSVFAISSSCGTTIFTMPSSAARSASIISPVNRNSSAKFSGTRCASMHGPLTDPIPRLACGHPNCALSDAMRMSDASAMPPPCARQNPFTAAIIGLKISDWYTYRSSVEISGSYSASLLPDIDTRSCPTENARPFPVITASQISGSSLTSCSRRHSSSRISTSIAFSLSGLFSRIYAARSRTSNSTTAICSSPRLA